MTTFSRRRFLASAASAVPLVAAGCAFGTRSASRSEREVRQLVRAGATRDGAGVKLARSLGGAALSMVDPFLLLDEFHSDDPADYLPGFPSHPHRGFETVSYVLEGAVEHRDSVGNHGHLGPGSAQWMTAGRGIVHSEMPRGEGTPSLWGFQLWVNLPAKDKWVRPRYQDVPPSAIRELDVGDARVRLVAGEAGGVRGPVDGIAVDPVMMDVTVPPGGRFVHELPMNHAAFAYVLFGEAAVGSSRALVPEGHLAVLGDGARVTIEAVDTARLLLVAGRPIGEPVARGGPFVMNTREEIDQAWADYRAGTLASG